MQEPASFEELVNRTQDKIVVVDEDGIVQYANGATRDLLGYEPSELVGVDAFCLVHPEDRACVMEAFQRLVDAEPGTVSRARFRYETRTGEWVHVESRLSNEHSDTLGGYVVSSRDVTDRVEVERERERMRNLLFELANESPDVHWMFDADWSDLLFVNDAVEEVYGIDRDTLEERPREFLSHVHPDDVPAVSAGMERLSDGEPVDMEYRVNPRENFARWVWVQGRPVVEDGTVERIVGFSRDVTDRHRRNRHLRVMDNLLRHNLRNDLNVILGRARLMQADVEPVDAANIEAIEAKGWELLNKADKQRRIIELIVDPDEPTTVDLREAVDRAVGAVRSEWDGATVEVDVPDALAVTALPHLENALRELMDNAIRHADADPRVRVAADERDGTVEVTVTDDCPPLPPSEVQVLNGEDPHSATHHGTGLGLWLVYWTVELSDGEIVVGADRDRETRETDAALSGGDAGTRSGNRITLRLPAAGSERERRADGGREGDSPGGETGNE